MAVESRVWNIAAVLAVLVGLWANPLLSNVARHLFAAPGYNDSAPMVMIDLDTVHYGRDGTVPRDLVSRWQARARSFEAIAPLQAWNIESGLQGERVAAGIFEMLGVKPWRGRTLGPENAHEVVVSYEWAAGDAAWIGKFATFGFQNYRVVGIMPLGFRLIVPDAQVWALLSPNAKYVETIGKLRAGVSPGQAQAELRSIAHDMRQYPARKLELVTLRQNRLRNVSFAYSMLKWNLGFVLLAALGSTAAFLNQRRRTITLGQQFAYVGFLIGKTVLVLCLIAGVWIVAGDRSVQRLFADGSNFAMPMFFWGFLLASWGATFWSLRDQQGRCRVCMSPLRMPVASGRWSSLVLDRPRTEYICTFGHGTLYVPGTRLLDIDAVNWTSHDDIWRELFAEPLSQ